MRPRRIQRQRAAGWRMPPGARYVGRPTKWGNPFRPELVGAELALALYRALLTGWDPSLLAKWPHEDEERVYAAHRAWERRVLDGPGVGMVADRARQELAGLDLSCWCRIDRPCHADILLEVANR